MVSKNVKSYNDWSDDNGYWHGITKFARYLEKSSDLGSNETKNEINLSKRFVRSSNR